MQLSLKPYVTTGVVIAGAAALVAAPIAASPPSPSEPVIASRALAVEPAALVDDLLLGLARLGDAAGETVYNALTFVGTEPGFIAAWPTALARNPQLFANILSAVVSIETSDFGFIPEPLVRAFAGENVYDAYIDVLDAIYPGGFGGLLPDPVPGADAIDDAFSALPPIVTGFTDNFAEAFDAVGLSLWGTALLAGVTPSNVLSVSQSLFTDPAGVASFVAYTLLNPFSNPVPIDSLYALGIEPLIDGAVNILPTPLADVVQNAKTSLDNALTGFLDRLPAPVVPDPPGASAPVDEPVEEQALTTERVGSRGSAPTAGNTETRTVAPAGAGDATAPADTDDADAADTDDADAASAHVKAPRHDRHVRLNVKKDSPTVTGHRPGAGAVKDSDDDTTPGGVTAADPVQASGGDTGADDAGAQKGQTADDAGAED